MWSENPTKSNQPGIDSSSFQTLAAAHAYWTADKGFHVHLQWGSLDEDLGIMTVGATFPDGKTSRVHYLMRKLDFGPLLSLRRSKEDTQSKTFEETKLLNLDLFRFWDNRWRGFEKAVEEFLVCQNYVQYAETLRGCGRRLSGSIKDENLLWTKSSESLMGLFQNLDRKVRGRGGLDFVRLLLSSGSDIRVSLGLSLTMDHFVDALQDELEAVYKRGGLSNDVRQESLALLSPQRRRALTSARSVTTVPTTRMWT